MNPYTVRTMVKDPSAFVGRLTELRKIYTLLASMQSCSVVGPRRIGKSSLLYYLTCPSTYSFYLPDSTSYVFAFVDLQEFAFLRAVGSASVQNGSVSGSPKQKQLTTLHQILNQRFGEDGLRTLCFYLEDVDYDNLKGGGKADKARELIEYLERRDRIYEIVEIGTQLRLDIAWHDLLDEGQASSLEQLNNFFSTAVERLCQASNGRLEADPAQYGTSSGFKRFLRQAADARLRLVLCCDEFEMLGQNPSFSADFFTYLRGLCSNYDLALVTSSRAGLFELCHQGNLQTSQFWNIFVPCPLGLMPEDEARTLIREPFTRAGGTITDDDIAFVLKIAGCHPFFVQMACYYLFDAMSDHGPLDYHKVEDRFLDEAQRYYTAIWKRLDGQERAALVALLHAEGRAIDRTLFRRLERSALVTGSSESPFLVSDSWRNFIKGQA